MANALTLRVRKVHRCRGTRRPDDICPGIIRPEGQCAARLRLVRICTGGSRLELHVR